MKTPADLRERYGEIFVLELPDGQQVPFKLLSLKDYFSYSKAIEAGLIPKSILENEIFEKCVLDNVLVNSIHNQKAGTPTVVADTILQYSAPRSIEEFQYFLNYNRNIVSNVLYQVINIICLGFNSYTPDDILSKDIYEILFLLALAERKLLETGALSEPLDFSGGERQPKQKKPKVDISKLREEYEKQKDEFNIHKLHQEGKERPKSVVESEIPSFDDRDREGNVSISMNELMYNNRTLEEQDLKTLQDAKVIFKDYLEQVAKGERIKIKSDEQRIEEYNKMVAEKRKKFREKLKKK